MSRKAKNPTMEVLFQRPTEETWTWSLRHSGEPVPCVVSKSIFYSEYDCFMEMARTADILHKALLSKAQQKHGAAYGDLNAITNPEKHRVPMPGSMKAATPIQHNHGVAVPEEKVVKGSGRLDANIRLPRFLSKVEQPRNFDISLSDKVETDEAQKHGTHVDHSIEEKLDE